MVTQASPEVGEFWIIETGKRRVTAQCVNTPDKGASLYLFMEDHPHWGVVPHETTRMESVRPVEKTERPNDWPL